MATATAAAAVATATAAALETTRLAEATAAAAVAAATAATEITAGGTFLAGASFIDFHGTTIQLSTVEFGDCILASFIIAHRYESKALGAAGFVVNDDLGFFDFAVSGEGFLRASGSSSS